MKELASQMKFEEAADIRDRVIHARRERLLGAGDSPLAMASGPVDLS
jgi:hypothetical protein